MRTPIFIAAMALAAAPALAQTAAPADPNAAPPSQTAPMAGPSGAAAAPSAAAPGAATPGAAAPGAAATAAAPAGDVTAQLTTGAMVYDPQGGQVGTIEAVNGADIVVSTGTTKASIPATSFGRGAMGPMLSLTRAQLEAAVAGGGSGGR